MSDSLQSAPPASDAHETPAELIARLEGERRSWLALVADARRQKLDSAAIVRRGTQALRTLNAELRRQRRRLRAHDAPCPQTQRS